MTPGILRYLRKMDGFPGTVYWGMSLLSLLIALLLSFGYWQYAQRREKDRIYARKIEKSAEKARLANDAKTRFLFNMSHDIRTPMNAIALVFAESSGGAYPGTEAKSPRLHPQDPELPVDILLTLHQSRSGDGTN